MAELWGRSARLEFGEIGKPGFIMDTSKILSKENIPEITFLIKKSIASQNTASIAIYNLKESSREIVNTAKEGKLFCELAVGYGGDNFTIFKGKAQTGGSWWTGSEWITSFEANDGLEAKDSKVNKSYAPNTDVKTMIKESLEKLGPTFKKAILDIKTEVTENGITLSGAVPMIIDKLIAAVPNQNLEFTIQDNVAYVKPATTIIDANNIPIISATTGMIGSPKKTKEGLEFEALIQKGLSPGRGVQLISQRQSYDGIYIIQKSSLKGSLRSGEWKAACEVKSTDKYQFVEAP